MEDDILCFIERVVVGVDLRIEGWSFHRRYGACRVDVLVEDGGGQAAPCQAKGGIERRDVRLATGLATAEHCGFRAVAALPVNAKAVFLRLSGWGSDVVLPILAREGLSLRSWTIITPNTRATLEYDFFTESGVRYARSAPPAFFQARTALAALTGEAARPMAAAATVIVPVYGGKPYLHPLVRSLIENTDPRHRIIFVDDGNPDQSVTAFLTALGVSNDNILVIRNARNEGYLRSVAVGVSVASQYAPQGHVVLLNSDTEVPPGWLERLLAPIENDPRIASVTPFSNAGTVCGFPAMPDDNAPPLGLAVEAVDAVFAALRPATPVEIPTGVGFCMAINRRALDEIGFFDAEAFGTGYGEEVDWCRRAARRGYINVIAPNLYVHHKHGGSFSAEAKANQTRRSGRIIQRRYPEFDAEVQDFIRADPLRGIRAAVLTKLAARHGRSGATVIFDHGRSGGAASFLLKEIERGLAAGRAIALVRPARQPMADRPAATLDIEIRLPEASACYPGSDMGDLAALLGELPVAEIVVNSLVGFGPVAPLLDAIGALRRERGAPLRILHHDYFPLCPSFNLIDATGAFCDLPDPDVCAACAAGNTRFEPEAFPGAAFSARDYRRAWQALFSLADRHIFFSKASVRCLSRAFTFPEGSVKVIPHFADHLVVEPILPPEPGIPAAVAVVGALNEAKGAGVLADMAALCQERRIPIVFEFFGRFDRLMDSPHFHDNGPYEPESLALMIEERGCQAIFIPSIWPETFCYVVDEVVGLGLPVGAFDLGAPAERLRLWPNGFLVPTVSASDALAALVDILRVKGGAS